EVAALGGVAGGTPGGVLVAEADESDGTVALYHPCWSVITNIEFDHMEHFGSRREVEDCFARLVAQTRRRVFYCADDPVASQLARSSDKALGYGFSDAADIRISGFREQEGAAAFCIAHEGGLETVRLPLAGRHNALNAAAAFTVAKNVGCEPCRIVEALAVCAPPRRRFETIVKTPVHVISDYAHHPTEIRALIGMTHHLQARRIVAVFQPHRYTRTRALGAQFPAAFAGVDEVVLAPVYAASESSSGGDTSQDLLAHFEQHGGTKTLLSDSLQNAWQYVRGILQEGDVLLLVGAGDIERMGPWAVEFFSDVQEKE
ncbi:MAG: hypothetical protein EOM20_07180, partial [Spartobacteria bacterium]|nr:hypothetical protein [Spartobacteria bacterium]